MNFLLYMLEGNMKVVFIWDQLFWVGWVFSCCPIAQNVLLFPVDKDFLTLFWLRGSVFQTVWNLLHNFKSMYKFTHFYSFTYLSYKKYYLHGADWKWVFKLEFVDQYCSFQVGFYLGFVSMWHEILLESPHAKQRYHVDLLSLFLNYCGT